MQILGDLPHASFAIEIAVKKNPHGSIDSAVTCLSTFLTLFANKSLAINAFCRIMRIRHLISVRKEVGS